MTSRHLIALLLLSTALLAGCSKDTKVGSDKITNFKEEAQKQRLGATTTTVPPTTVVTAQGPGKAAIGGTTTTAAPTTTTTAPKVTTTTEQPAFPITINSDGASTTQFDPSIARVYVGSYVKFTNTDSVARSIEADDNSFSSGPIAPGAAWVYKATTAGKFNYHDGTRPYAVGSLEVVAR